MEEIQATCFVCDTPLASPFETCPNCGYKYDDFEDMLVCPNYKLGVCSITENMCMRRDTYETCPEKNKFEAGECLF